jgi:methylmalonyl-CoA epimerase
MQIDRGRSLRIEQVDHIGIAVRDILQALSLYTDVLGLEVSEIEDIPDLQVRVAFIPVGDVLIELVQPTSDDAPLAKRIHEQGEGLYHLAFRVEGIDAAFKEMKEAGVQMREDRPRPGGMGSKVALSKGDTTHNVIIELVQRPHEP